MKNIKKFFGITLVVIILSATTVLATTGTVNAPNGLILRKEASKTGEVIMTISDDSSVEILEEDGEWYKVKYNSKEGYLFAEYVNVDEEESESTSEADKSEEASKEDTDDSEADNTETQTYPQKQTTKSNLKIYTIPSVTASTIGNVKKGKEITINYELNDWVNITYGNTQGWARKYFVNGESTVEEVSTNNDEETDITEQTTEDTTTTIEKNQKGYVNASTSVNIREEASTSSNIIDTLLRNTEVTVLGEEGDFYKIQYQDITGYIAKEFISASPIKE